MKNNLSNLVFTVLLISISAVGQTPPTETVSTSKNQTTADENFKLNIQNERITETNFARSTNVELNNPNRGGFRVEVGVGVRAERVDIILRGIFGNVRFRASLETIKNRVEQSPQSLTAPR